MPNAEFDLALSRTVATGLRSLWLFRKRFVLFASIIFAACVVLILSLTPLYSAASLLIGGQSKPDQLGKTGMSTTETNTSFAQVAQSFEVTEEAVRAVGLENLIDPARLHRASILAQVRGAIFGSVKTENLPLIKIAVPRIMQDITVKAEPNSNILSFGFRHPDPEIAARFVNALSQAFIEQQISIYNKEGATALFQTQKDRFDEDAKRAAENLRDFSSKSGIYSQEEQRKLLLNRQSDLFDSISTIRSSIAEKRGERQALLKQLTRLAPGAGSAYAESLLKDLDADSRPTPAPAPPIVENRQNGPPLLFNKIYQDSMSALFKVNAELSGAEEQEHQASQEVTSVQMALKRLADNAARFDELSRAVTQSVYNSEFAAKRLVEEEILAESNSAKFSTFRVFQPAEVPLRPVFPNYPLSVLLSALFSMAASAALTLYTSRHATARMRHGLHQLNASI